MVFIYIYIYIYTFKGFYRALIPSFPSKNQPVEGKTKTQGLRFVGFKLGARRLRLRKCLGSRTFRAGFSGACKV